MSARNYGGAKSPCYKPNMITGYELGTLGNTELLSKLATLVKRGNELTADLLTHLAEVDRRRLHLDLGYSSLFAYCVERLRLSEPAAGRRIAAARVCRRFPKAFGLVATGDLHLSALCALHPHLNPVNANELFEACRGKTRRQVEEIIARRFPGRDVRPSIRRLPETRHRSPQVTPTKTLQPPPKAFELAPSVSVPSALAEQPAQIDVAPTNPTSPKPRIEPTSPERYGVHFTANANLKEKIDQARALASHRVPDGDLAALVELAFDALIRDLLKQRFAVGRKPRTPSSDASLSPGESRPRSSRHIPAAVAREVYERDKGQCTFVAADGRRCSQRRWLEIEHIKPWSTGGPPTAANLCLLCRAHNQHRARICFGNDAVERAIERARSP